MYRYQALCLALTYLFLQWDDSSFVPDACMTSRVRVSFRDAFGALAISGRDGPTSDTNAQDGANLTMSGGSVALRVFAPNVVTYQVEARP